MSVNTETAVNYNFQIPDMPSRYMRAFLSYLGAMENWNIDAILACFDEALLHRILPASLGRQPRTKECYAAFLSDTTRLFRGNKFIVSIHEVIESGHKLAVHCSSKSLSAHGTPYNNEYSLFIHYVPLPAGVDPYSALTEGEKLPKMVLVKQFVDSGFSAPFFAAEKAALVVNELA